MNKIVHLENNQCTMFEKSAQCTKRISHRDHTVHTNMSVWNCGFHSPADEDHSVLGYNAPIFTVVQRVFLNYLKMEAANSCTKGRQQITSQNGVICQKTACISLWFYFILVEASRNEHFKVSQRRGLCSRSCSEDSTIDHAQSLPWEWDNQNNCIFIAQKS
jgi:hypothetical protein